ncbi:MAG: ketoacyl-ACP synthase III [Fimbriimonas sp.]
MALTPKAIGGVRISGIASAVPTNVVEIEAPSAPELARSTRALGVETRRIASPDVTTADLCEAAARRLLADANVAPEEIDVLIFVSQTPDYGLPATSCLLHERLGLRKGVAAFDVNLGCSGYVYGLWTMASLIAASGMRRGLLLVGDTLSKVCGDGVEATFPVFGDAGTATLVEADPEAPPISFSLGTDGAGAEHLVVPAGGFRTSRASEGGVGDDLYMDGGEIFTFFLREVPPQIDQVRQDAGWTMEDVDHFILHQANGFMLEHLRKRLKAPTEKFVLGLRDYGNTSSASIPLAITTEIAEEVRKESRNLILAGFGVGFSWGTAAVAVGPIVVSDLVEVAPKELAYA